jgi:hypothetical protein
MNTPEKHITLDESVDLLVTGRAALQLEDLACAGYTHIHTPQGTIVCDPYYAQLERRYQRRQLNKELKELLTAAATTT